MSKFKETVSALALILFFALLILLNIIRLFSGPSRSSRLGDHDPNYSLERNIGRFW